MRLRCNAPSPAGVVGYGWLFDPWGTLGPRLGRFYVFVRTMV